MNKINKFFSELKRRNVFKVATAYAITAWLIIQISDTVFPRLGFPDWAVTFIIILVIIGFPIALIITWAFELTPEGLKKSDEINLDKSIAPKTGKKLNFIIIATLIVALGYFIWESRFSSDNSNTDQQQKITEKIKKVTLEKSVAVLPFIDLSKNSDQEWFSDGLTEEILNSLARLPELKVTSRTSSFTFKGSDEDIKDIANKLGVTYIVEGSVRRIDNELRLTAQLIRASDGFHIWSQTYNRNTEHLFEVQEDIAEKIAKALDIYLDDNKRKIMFDTGTRNVDAFEAYLKGKQIYSEIHQTKTDKTLWDANVYFEKAIEIDPTFVQPAIYHMDAYSHILLHGSDNLSSPSDTISKEEAQRLLIKDLDFAIVNTKNPLTKLVAQINRAFYTDNWKELPNLIAVLKSNKLVNQIKLNQIVWMSEILILLQRYDIMDKVVDNSKVSDPYSSDTWMTNLDVALATGSLKDVQEIVIEAKKYLPKHNFFRYSFRSLLINQDKEKLIKYIEKYDKSKFLQSYLQLLEGNKNIDYYTNKEKYDISKLEYNRQLNFLFYYNEVNDQGKIKEIVQKIDSLPYGTPILGMYVAHYGNRLQFDLDDTPNFKERLMEAGMDVTTYKKVPRISDVEKSLL